MPQYAEKPIEQKTFEARPQPDVDRKALRASIVARFSRSLEYLGR